VTDKPEAPKQGSETEPPADEEFSPEQTEPVDETPATEPQPLPDTLDDATERVPSLAIYFGGPDSAAFGLARADWVSPWQLFIIAEHLRITAEMELQRWMMEQEMKKAKPAIAVPPPQASRRGVREIFKGGRWKPPAERK